jgi:plastocyanin
LEKTMMRPLTLIAIPLTVMTVAACGSSNEATSTVTVVTFAATKSTPTPTTTGAAATSAPTQTATPESNGAVDIAADPSGLLKYTQTALSTTAGKATIDFANQSSVPHNVVLINSASKILGQTPIFSNGSKSFRVALPPGTYTYYCSVPGHRQAGMQGTITVR